MASENSPDRYHYPQSEPTLASALPEGFRISVIEGPFQVVDPTRDSDGHKSTVDLNKDAVGYTHRFKIGDGVNATVKDKRGILQKGSFKIKAERLDKAKGVWEYKLEGGNKDEWVRDGALKKL